MIRIANLSVWVEISKRDISIDYGVGQKLIYKIDLQDLNINYNSY
jgi:hypothetical protein